VEERVRPPASLRGRADCAVLHASPTHRLPPMRSRHVQSAAHAATIHRRGAAEPDTLDAVQLVNFGTARRPDPPPSCRARPGIHLATAATLRGSGLARAAHVRSFRHPGLDQGSKVPRTLALAEIWAPAQGQGDEAEAWAAHPVACRSPTIASPSHTRRAVVRRCRVVVVSRSLTGASRAHPGRTPRQRLHMFNLSARAGRVCVT
jgi:hypothetical protein